MALQKVKRIRCIDFASRTSPAPEASACSLPPACPAPGDAHERVAGRLTASRASIRRVGQLREAWFDVVLRRAYGKRMEAEPGKPAGTNLCRKSSKTAARGIYCMGTWSLVKVDPGIEYTAIGMPLEQDGYWSGLGRGSRAGGLRLPGPFDSLSALDFEEIGSGWGFMSDTLLNRGQ